MSLKVTFRQLSAGYGALARLAEVVTEDGQINYRLGKTFRQATAAIQDLEKEMARLRDLFPQEDFIDRQGNKAKKVAEAYSKKFQPLADRLFDTEIKLWGTAMTFDDANKFFKPSPAELSVLLGWIITEKDEEGEGYECPQFAVDLASLDIALPANGSLRPALVVEGGVD